MTRFIETVRLFHSTLVSASEVSGGSRSHATVVAVCIEIVLLLMLLSAWPLWWFLLKAAVILAATLGVAELALRVVYWRKDRRPKEGASKTTAVAEISTRLSVRCSDAQGQLRHPHVPADQIDRMAQAILRNHSVSRTPFALRIGKLKLRALTRFIHGILN